MDVLRTDYDDGMGDASDQYALDHELRRRAEKLLRDHQGTALAHHDRDQIMAGDLSDPMTDMGLECLANDLDTDRAHLVPNHAVREIGRKLSAGGNVRSRIQDIIENGAADLQTAKRHCSSCCRDLPNNDTCEDDLWHVH
eukprot:2155344-Pyramimonas_sp.AAC.1